MLDFSVRAIKLNRDADDAYIELRSLMRRGVGGAEVALEPTAAARSAARRQHRYTINAVSAPTNATKLAQARPTIVHTHQGNCAVVAEISAVVVVSVDEVAARNEEKYCTIVLVFHRGRAPYYSRWR